MINNLHNFTINPYYDTAQIQEYDNLAIGSGNLKNQEVIEAKQTELRDRAFTTFCLGNWDETHLDNLAQLAREINTKFVPYRSNMYGGLADRSEKDSYNENTSYICRAFIEGSPETGFKVIEKEINFFAYKSELLTKDPLVTSALSHIFKLLPGEMNPKIDRFEVSLIRQTAKNMPELQFHRDLRHQVFVLVLACNLKENDGAYLSIKDTNKFPSKDYAISVNERNSSFHEKHLTSVKGNGYLIRENTDSSPNGGFYVQHRRGPFSTSVQNPERITLRILVDSQRQPATEAI